MNFNYFKGFPKGMGHNMSIFKLHYQYTSCLLLLCTLLVYLRTNFGTPIACIADSSLNDVIDTYCWNIPWHIIPELKKESNYSNIVDQDDIQNTQLKEKKLYHQTHQWIGILLFLMALLFYLPRYLVKMFEGDLLEVLKPVPAAETTVPESPPNVELSPDCVEQPTPVQHTNDNKKKAKYFAANMTTYKLYANGYICCEILNSAFAILLAVFINGFGNHFFGQGNFFNVLKKPEDRIDSLATTFPLFTKCIFNKEGPGGTTLEYDAVCVLSVNSTNQIIFIFLSYWLPTLCAFSVIAVVTRCVLLAWPEFRRQLLKARSLPNDPSDPGDPNESLSNDPNDDIFHKLEYGDWFVLYQLRKHSDYFSYQQFIKEVAGKIKHND